MIIDTSYKEKIINLNLTIGDIESIIDELSYANHNLFVFMNYQKIIDKLKDAKDNKSVTEEKI